MRHTRRFTGRLAASLLPTALLLAPGPRPAAAADWGPGNFMLQALGQMMGSVLEVSRETDYGYDDGISIMAAFLEPGATIDFVRTVQEGGSYAIAGGGDDDVRDLDLVILDGAGRPIASDTKSDNHPVVVFDAPYTGRVTIRVNLYAARSGSFCVASVLRRGGWNVPRENLIRSAVGIISAANYVDRNVKGAVAFQAGPNQWAMYGGVYRRGEQLEIINVGLGSGRRVFLAAGDTQARDIDLFVSVGREEAHDTDPDANPIVDVEATNVSTATLRIHNVDSGGPCLILATILQVE